MGVAFSIERDSQISWERDRRRCPGANKGVKSAGRGLVPWLCQLGRSWVVAEQFEQIGPCCHEVPFGPGCFPPRREKRL